MFDAAISFSGHHREFAHSLAAHLDRRGVRVFYDEWEQGRLWGTNLVASLNSVYERETRYVIVLHSKPYLESIWANHEATSAFSTLVRKKGSDYILPVKMDEEPVAGPLKDISWVNCEIGVEEIAELFVKSKLPRGQYAPPNVSDAVKQAYGTKNPWILTKAVAEILSDQGDDLLWERFQQGDTVVFPCATEGGQILELLLSNRSLIADQHTAEDVGGILFVLREFEFEICRDAPHPREEKFNYSINARAVSVGFDFRVSDAGEIREVSGQHWTGGA